MKQIPIVGNGGGSLFKEFYHILAPFDLKNSMGVKLRYVRDRYNDDNWLYSPISRKIRKLIVKQDEDPHTIRAFSTKKTTLAFGAICVPVTGSSSEHAPITSPRWGQGGERRHLAVAGIGTR